MSYAGWENYETWSVVCYLNDLLGDEFQFESVSDVKSFVEDAINLQWDRDLLRVNLLNASLARVNWMQVLDAFREG